MKWLRMVRQAVKNKVLLRRAHKRSQKVLIVMPVPLTFQVELETASFIARVVLRGTAEWEALPARAAEDARNRILRKQFISFKEYTHAFFLDADTWPYDDFAIEKLLSHNKSFVCGATAVQRNPNRRSKYHFDRGGTVREVEKDKDGLPLRPMKVWNIQMAQPNGGYKNLRRNFENPAEDDLPKRGLFEAARVGGTTMLIKREVFEQMEVPYMFTQRDKFGDVSLGEDYTFCDKVRELGIKIWVDPQIQCGHRQNVDVGRY